MMNKKLNLLLVDKEKIIQDYEDMDCKFLNKCDIMDKCIPNNMKYWKLKKEGK